MSSRQVKDITGQGQVLNDFLPNWSGYNGLDHSLRFLQCAHPTLLIRTCVYSTGSLDWVKETSLSMIIQEDDVLVDIRGQYAEKVENARYYCLVAFILV